MDTVEHTNPTSNLKEVLSSNQDAMYRFLYAGFLTRFFAYLIDLLVVYSINAIITRPLLSAFNLTEAKLYIDLLSVMNITTSLVFFLYFILMTFFFQATLGKMAFGLKVVSLKGNALTKWQIVTRELFGRYISMAAAGIPYLVVAFTKKHQGIHDLFADTSVLKESLKDLNDELHTTFKKAE
ncbi:membrane protein [Pontibacillus halophilus JSM 076056 = DSM 19796]|uniref:Membrane protein n=1 Tax=Pontibacillus halophilus JSM 076056 = DSM 19796 TaxID=1385510 RepID=A0A0A5GJD7_9BACI|nr:RDD family protein [Pontibacillus halophilus]KGX91333.1 membrane protein [Pontibacillus halophilus JSM 076056 = DSM 19796]